MQPDQTIGFYTDTTVCIGCKACEVACKQWNELPGMTGPAEFSGQSYDNTVNLTGDNWRHVAFVERFDPQTRSNRWLFLSDVCKHCHYAGCLEACPTGAIIKTDHDSVLVQEDLCNGCGYCVAACPFGVIGRSSQDGLAHKCTLCVDRLDEGLEPACAKVCPTESIQFGPLEELTKKANERVDFLRRQGVSEARLWGLEGDDGGKDLGGLHAFYLLTDEAEMYGLPSNPVRPSERLILDALYCLAAFMAVVLGFAALVGGAS